MSDHLTTEQFLHDVRDHKLTIIRDDGVYRHLLLKRPGSSCMHFELITWPGYLAYVGDMGAFVFQRLEDMLEFFRRNPDHLFRIDMRYWAEKCEAQDTRGSGIKEWDPERFKREVTEQRRKLLVQHGKDWTSEQRKDLWVDLQYVVDAGDQEHTAITAFQEWSYQTKRGRLYLSTDDFPSCETYTRTFRWCCYALAWGIKQYDDAKDALRDARIAT